MMTLNKNSPAAVDAAWSPGQENGVRGEWRWLAVFAGLYVALYAAFYPQMYTSLDESANFGMAYVLRHGTIYPSHAGHTLALSPTGPHGLVYRFPIGFPAALALFTFAGWHSFFLINPILHLMATGLFAKLLQSQKISPGWAVLYLLYPGFVLYDRTLFSDPFAASLTTMALYFLLCGPSRPVSAGLCMGAALLARSTSLVVTLILATGLLAADWRMRRAVPVRQWHSVKFGLGLLPFVLINGVYNDYTMGGPFRSAYRVDMLSPAYLLKFGPLYAASLLLLFPGMLLAPWLYRGRCWRQCLAATSAVILLAALYHESTFGGNTLQTLVSVSRQVLPALPFYLFAYCAVLSSWLPLVWTKKRAALPAVGSAWLLVAAGITLGHQKYLHILRDVQREIAQTLPAGATVYGNKDVFKLYQPEWQKGSYRELPNIGAEQADSDLKAGPVFAVLFLRSRGVANEDAANAEVKDALARRFVVVPGPLSRSGLLTYDRIIALRKNSGIAE